MNKYITAFIYNESTFYVHTLLLPVKKGGFYRKHKDRVVLPKIFAVKENIKLFFLTYGYKAIFIVLAVFVRYFQIVLKSTK